MWLIMSPNTIIGDLQPLNGSKALFFTIPARLTCKSSAVVIVKFVTASINRDKRATTGDSSFRSHALEQPKEIGSTPIGVRLITFY